MHNSTAEDGKQNHTLGLTLPRPEDVDDTDLEVTEIVEGTLANRDTSEDRLLFPVTNGQGTTGNLHDMTLPSANTFRMINIKEKWLRRYLPDGHNSQIGNVIDREEVTTDGGEQWYKIKIPYLRRFYSTESYLVGKWNDCIYALRSDEEKEMVCVKIMWIPYDLVVLEELLRDNQYLRLKGIKTFEEEGKNILDRLVSEEERAVPQDINFTKVLSYGDRQRLYERRLKLTKALPIMLQEMCQLENENDDKIELYITQKSKFTAGLCMIIDQIDRILRKDDERRQRAGLQILRAPKFYPSGVDLWVEMPVDIIRKAAEEHKECIKNIDDVRNRSQIKHISIGKMSERISKIPSVMSAFNRVMPSMSEGCKASPVLKEKGCQEAIAMAAKFQNPRRGEQNNTMVILEDASSSRSTMAQEVNNTETGSDLIEERQQRRQRVLEQFLREAKRKGEMMAAHENKIREEFRRRQETEEWKLREEENRRQILLDEVLAIELQVEEEWEHMRQAGGIIEEVGRQEKLRQIEKEKQLAEEFKKIQKQLSEDLKQQMEHSYQQKIWEIHRRSKMRQPTETYRVLEPLQRNLGKEGYEVLPPTEQLLCWRCGEAGHRKKDCLKTLFCTNCGKNGHTFGKCRQLVRGACTYCTRPDHTEEYCPSR